MSVVQKEFYRARELVEAGIAPSLATLYRWIAAGQFPRSIKLSGTGTSVFRRSDIDAWLAERAAVS